MNMSKLGDGDEAEWRKAFPILFNVAFATLRWKLGLSFDDAEDVAQESVAEIINSKFKFKDKTFKDLKRFTGVVAYNKGVDFLRFVNSEKRGSGGVLSLNEKIGEKGITRLELVASRLENFDYYKLFDYVSAVDDCRNETLNEKEKNFIHSYYIFGDCHREIAKKNKLPNEKSIGITIHRSLVKLEKCLNAKKFENPFNHENLGP
jgi:DNA-directed RNA polymerase specialized sigma24 family protein